MQNKPHIPDNIDPEIKEVIEFRLRVGMPVVVEDGWKYLAIERARKKLVAEILTPKK